MADDLRYQRCFHHGHREAVARCPECSRYFCRECITEHEDRVLCSTCLKTVVKPRILKRIRFAWISGTARLAVGLLIAWIFFYLLGESLLAIPVHYHDGSVWEQIFDMKEINGG